MNIGGASRGVLSRGVSLLGLAAVCASVATQFGHGHLALWALVCSLLSCVAWLMLIVLRVGGFTVSLALAIVMVGCGAIAAEASGGASVLPAAIAVLWLARDLRRPIWIALVLGAAAVATTLLGALFAPITPLALTTMLAGIVVAFLGGQGRRQYLLADIRSRELIEEQARADVLSARAALAHDIHDVLAHSLGGLVIQLDAVDALLDAGNTDAAAAKVRDARALAAEGLSEARRAVAALSSSDASGESTSAGANARVSGDAVAGEVTAMLAAHESLGGVGTLAEHGARVEVSGSLAAAMRRAAQEGLTNARKHAPGEPVTVTLRWRTDGVSLTISNPVGAPTNAAGGGHGLVGMRERFAALPGGAVTSGLDGGRFVVTAKAATA